MIDLCARLEPRPRIGNDCAIVDFLRAMVSGGPPNVERFHTLFVDSRRVYLGDSPMGQGGSGGLSVRMRDLFDRAFSLGANGIVVAHNHPSGDCRPSAKDISATARLKGIAEALDIQLLDHLIFTQDAVYSMRAGGNL